MRRVAIGAGAAVLLVLAGAFWLPTVAGASGDVASLAGRALVYLIEQQRQAQAELAAALRAVDRTPTPLAVWSLVGGSFFYGVLHAAGPGHGKAVLATYLLTQANPIGRGLWLTVAASLCQGLTAIVLVLCLAALAGWALGEVTGGAGWLERLSCALLVGIGGVLAARAAMRLRDGLLPGTARSDGDDGCCSHARLPLGAASARGAWQRLGLELGVVLSIGLRPCTGAILVMTLAYLLGSLPAGVGAVLAMSAGTALAVALIASLALGARRWATAAVAFESRAMAVAAHLTSLLGGLAIATIALGLFWAAGGRQPLAP